MKYSVKINKGKILWETNHKLVEYIQTIANDTIVDVTLSVKENPRSNNQNKLWWKWMDIIGESIGYNKQEIHDILKVKFLLREEIIDGATNKYTKSTSTLTKKEFAKLTSDVFFWANDTLNINLPNE